MRVTIQMRLRLLLCLALITCGWTPAVFGATEAEMFRYLERAEQRYAEVRDYQAIMVSRERINGALEPEKSILLKFQRPFRVYMKWLEGLGKGREGLYVAEAHDGKFLVYEPNGIRRLFTAALDPRDRRVLEVSRHPVTDIGIGRILEIIGENTRRAAKQRVLALADRGPAEVGGRKVRQIEGILPQDPRAAYYGHRVILSFDEEHGLPIRAVVYDWENRLVEDYAYTQLYLNPGFTMRDFDPANTEYSFSRWRLPLSGS